MTTDYLRSFYPPVCLLETTLTSSEHQTALRHLTIKTESRPKNKRLHKVVKYYPDNNNNNFKKIKIKVPAVAPSVGRELMVQRGS